MMKRIAVISLIIAIISISLSILVYLQSKNTDKPVVVAGVIRNMDDRGWYVINDGAHIPINIDSIDVENGLILIHYGFTASAIHTFIVTPDETFARAGYFVGSSVGLNKATIAVSQIVKGEVIPVDASKIKSQLGNFWIYGLFGVDKTAVQTKN